MARAYTYLIGWSNPNLWYYGSRYANTVPPEDDLWKIYTTSSHSRVDETVLLYGEPDVIQVRRTFATGPEAVAWEDTVLRRINAVKSPKWLNEGRGGKEFYSRPKSQQTKDKIRNSLKGKKRQFTKEWKENLSKGKIGKKLNLTPEGLAKRAAASRTPEHCAKMSSIKKDYWKDEQNIDRQRTQKSTKCTFAGRKHSIETKAKMSAASKDRKPEIVECPYCKKKGSAWIMPRWHFSNCKSYSLSLAG